MNDFEIQIQFTSRDGNVVVKNFNTLEKAVDDLNKTFSQTQGAGNKADRGMRSAASGARTLTRENEKVNASLQSTIRHAHLMAGGLATLAAAMKGLDMADDFNLLEQRVAVATEATGDFVAANDALFNAAQRNRAEFDTTVDVFQRIGESREDIGSTNAEIIRVTGSLQQMGAISGAANANMSAGLTQFAQAMAGGVVRAEEFNSLVENIPALVGEIAKGFNLTKGELRAVMLEGELLSKEVFEVLLAQADDIQARFDRMPLTMAGSMVVFENSVSRALSRLDQAHGATGSIAAQIKSLSEHIDAMSEADLQNVVAMVAAVTGGLAAVTVLSRMGVGITSIAAGSVAASAGLRQMAAGGSAAMVTTNALGQVVSKTTMQTRLLTAATAQLRTGLAFLGGPAGLALLAGWGIYEYMNAARDAAPDVEVLTGETFKLADALESARNQAALGMINDNNQKILETSEQLKELSVQIRQTEQDIAALAPAANSSPTGADLLFGLTNKLETLTEQSENLATVQGELMDANVALADTEANMAEMFSDSSAAVEGKSTKLSDALEKNQQFIDTLAFELKAMTLTDEQLLLQNNLRKLSADATDKQRAAVVALTGEQITLQNALNNAKVITGLQDELRLLNMTELARQKEINLRKLSADATDEQRNAVEQLTEALFLADATEQLDEMTSKVQEFGGAWSSVGNVILDTFGSLADKLNALSELHADYSASVLELEEKRAEFSAIEDLVARESALEKLSATEEKLNRQYLQGQLGAFRQITGAASEMFDEQSRERQALHAMETALTAIEIGLALEKAAANAIEAITNQGTGDPYTAFIRIGAMMALMAGLGVFSGGTSVNVPSAADNQENQGTGTVLGDALAKSESLVRSFERFEDIEIDQLAELRGIRMNLLNLSSGIEALARSFVAGDVRSPDFVTNLGTTQNNQNLVNLAKLPFFGDNLVSDLVGGIFGSLFGSTKRELVDSGIEFYSQQLGDILATGLVDGALFATVQITKKKLFGLVKNTSFSTEYSALDGAISAQLADIFGFIADTVLSAAETLGFDSVTRTTTTYAEQWDFTDVGFVAAGIRNFWQQYVEVVTTTTEMSLEEALENYHFAGFTLSVEGLTGEEIQAELEAVFSQQADLIAEYLVPSITEYQRIGEGAFETLTRVAREQVIFNDALSLTGHNLSELSNLLQIDIAQGIINLTGGIEQFRDLSSQFFAEFFSEQEQFAYLESAIADVFELLGIELPASREQFRSLVESLDITTTAGQETYAQLIQLVPSMVQYYEALEQTNAVLDEANAAQQSYADNLQGQLDALYGDASRLRETRELVNIERRLHDERVRGYERERQQRQQLNAFMDGLLLGDLSVLSPGEQLDEALAQLNVATTDNFQNIATATLTAARAVHASSAGYFAVFDLVKARAQELLTAPLAYPENTALAAAEAQLAMLEAEIAAAAASQNITSMFEAMIAAQQNDPAALEAALLQMGDMPVSELQIYNDLQSQLTSLFDLNSRESALLAQNLRSLPLDTVISELIAADVQLSGFSDIAQAVGAELGLTNSQMLELTLGLSAIPFDTLAQETGNVTEQWQHLYNVTAVVGDVLGMTGIEVTNLTAQLVAADFSPLIAQMATASNIANVDPGNIGRLQTLGNVLGNLNIDHPTALDAWQIALVGLSDVAGDSVDVLFGYIDSAAEEIERLFQSLMEQPVLPPFEPEEPEYIKLASEVADAANDAIAVLTQTARQQNVIILATSDSLKTLTTSIMGVGLAATGTLGKLSQYESSAAAALSDIRAYQQILQAPVPVSPAPTLTHPTTTQPVPIKPINVKVPQPTRHPPRTPDNGNDKKIENKLGELISVSEKSLQALQSVADETQKNTSEQKKARHIMRAGSGGFKYS